MSPVSWVLQQLKALPRDREFQQMLQRLEDLKPPKAAALVLVHHLTRRAEAAERALEVFRSWQVPDDYPLTANSSAPSTDLMVVVGWHRFSD